MINTYILSKPNGTAIGENLSPPSLFRNCMFAAYRAMYLSSGIIATASYMDTAFAGSGGNIDGQVSLGAYAPWGTIIDGGVASDKVGRTILYVTRSNGLPMTPHAWKGCFLTTDQTVLIEDNTTTAITVLDDLIGLYTADKGYYVTNPHIDNGEVSIGKADPDYAPAEDYDGIQRTLADGLSDIGAYECPTGILDRSAPWTAIWLDSSEPTTSETLNINWSGDDFHPVTGSLEIVSGLQGVQIYYRRNGGEWIAYGSPTLDNPILFDSSQTGGPGVYQFYSVGIDNAGNVEASESPFLKTIQILSPSIGTRIYVDRDATGAGTGLDWSNAMTSLPDAVSAAAASGAAEVWVAEGIYRGAIQLPSNVAVYGGFSGTETDLGERLLRDHPTVIDISTGNSNEQGYTGAVFMVGTTNTRLDGFSITGCNYFAQNLTQQKPVYCENCDASNTIANCRIEGNQCSHQGCLMLVDSSIRIVNCVVSGNLSPGGQSVLIQGGAPTFVNCTFTHNRAFDLHFSSDDEVEGILIDSSFRSTFINCIIGDLSGRQIQLTPGSAAPYLDNCLFYETHSGIYFDESTRTTLYDADALNQSASSASGNRFGDPRFRIDGAGSWTSTAVYSSVDGTTTFVDANAHFATGALTGQFVQFSALDLHGRQVDLNLLVLDNTATQLVVRGDETAFGDAGSSWTLVTSYLSDGSAALDRGRIDGAPATDIDGDARPGADGLLDIGADEAPSEAQPSADSDLPPALSDLVWLDFWWAGIETGAPATPFNSVAEAMAAVKSGGTVRIRAGLTPEYGRITKPMRLEADGGPVRIGSY